MTVFPEIFFREKRKKGGLVLADLEGPGVIYRIWTPTPTDDLLSSTSTVKASPGYKLNSGSFFWESSAI